MPTTLPHPAKKPDPGVVISKAVGRASAQLGLSAKALAAILGLSEASVSRMKHGGFRLEPATKPFELGVLFVRMFRSLDAIAGGDRAVAKAWLGNENVALGARPADKIQSVAGLVDVIAYLDARRALV
jgi:hypothetical protein